MWPRDSTELNFCCSFTRLRSTNPEGFQNGGQRYYFGHQGEDMKESWKKNTRLLVSCLSFHLIMGLTKSSRRRKAERVRLEGHECKQGIDWETWRKDFISVFNQLDTQNLFHNKFYFMPLRVSSTCAHHQEVKIALHSLWYHHTYRWPSGAPDGHL